MNADILQRLAASVVASEMSRRRSSCAVEWSQSQNVLSLRTADYDGKKGKLVLLNPISSRSLVMEPPPPGVIMFGTGEYTTG